MADSLANPSKSSLHVLVREKSRFFVTPFPRPPESQVLESLPEAKSVVYSPDGSCFASIEAENHSIEIRDGATAELMRSFGGLNDKETPLKVSYIAFSPKGTYLLAWCRPAADINVPNLGMYVAATGEFLGGFHQKVFREDLWPYVQWSDDESFAVKAVTNNLQFFPGNNFSKFTAKLNIPGVTKFALSSGSAPYTVVAFIAGKSGAAGRYAMYTHPDQGGKELLNKAAFKADSVDFKWSPRGDALLAIASTNVDNTGKSYYGQSEVYFMDKHGSVCQRIQLPQEGPTYDAAWSPTGDNFIIIYGFMPACATLFNDSCEPVYNLGTGSWNTISFCPHGRYVAMAGFGSLAGRVVFWDSLKHSVVGRVELPCTTEYSWSPCSRYFLGATTYPRLREANGYKIARIDGQIIHHADLKDTHLYQATFRPGNSKALPDPLTVADQMIGGPMQKPGGKNSFNSTNGVKKGGVYRPPGSRGTAASFSLHDDVKAGKVNKVTFLTSNSKPVKSAPSAARKIIPGMDPSDYVTEKPSKSSQRKKKKEKERLAQMEKAQSNVAGINDESVEAEAVTVEVPNFESVAAAEKKLKGLLKRLRQISALKEARDEGKELKEEQLNKVAKEPKLQGEVDAIQKFIDTATKA